MIVRTGLKKITSNPTNKNPFCSGFVLRVPSAPALSPCPCPATTAASWELTGTGQEGSCCSWALAAPLPTHQFLQNFLASTPPPNCFGYSEVISVTKSLFLFFFKKLHLFTCFKLHQTLSLANSLGQGLPFTASNDGLQPYRSPSA